MLQAQIYTTSSATYQSYSTGGMHVLPTPSSFRSTSSYMEHRVAYNPVQPVSHTAPMQVANGTIRTVASTIQGGVLADEQEYSSASRIRGRQNTMAPPEYTQPIGDGWDVAIFLGLCCAVYVLWASRKNKQAV